MRRTVLLMLLAVVVSAAEARAEFYQWTDRDGRQFYTNEKEKVPAEYRDAARPVEVRDDRVSTEGARAGGAAPAAKVREQKDRDGRGEAYWRKRAENLRRQIREQQGELDVIAEQERNDEDRPKKQTAKARKKANASRAAKRAKIEKKLARLQNELDVQLPEEARKADAYPGWIRE